jgi:hypothetical protein
MEIPLSFKFLCIAALIVSCQQSNTNTPPKPQNGSFTRNIYRNDFFGLSYRLPKEWHKSRVDPAPLPSGAYYLFIADRYTANPLLSRVVILADPESANRPGLSTGEYLSAYVRGQVKSSHAEVVREPSSFVIGDNTFDRADSKWSENGTTFYASMVSVKRNGYWLSWSFTTASQRELDDAVGTLEQISLDHPSPH